MYVVGYLAFSVPAVIAGFAAVHFGLLHTTYVYGAGVVLLALAVLALAEPRSEVSAEPAAVPVGAALLPRLTLVARHQRNSGDGEHRQHEHRHEHVVDGVAERRGRDVARLQRRGVRAERGVGDRAEDGDAERAAHRAEEQVVAGDDAALVPVDARLRGDQRRASRRGPCRGR